MCASCASYVQDARQECEEASDALQRVKNLHSVGRVCVRLAEDVLLTEQPRVLSGNLAVLAALPCVPRHVVLCGWTATPGKLDDCMHA